MTPLRACALLGAVACVLGLSACGEPDDLGIGTRLPSPAAAQDDAVGGQRWSFHLVSHDGWEYDAMVVVDAIYAFRKDASTSPAGKAKLIAAVTGGANSVFTPTANADTAPQVFAVYGDANQGAWFPGPADLSFAAGPCTTDVSPPAGFPAAAFFCQITRGSMDSGITNDLDEATVDSILRAVRAGRPTYFEFGLGGAGRCRLGLFPDGRAATEYDVDRKSCRVTGPRTAEAAH